MFSPVSKRFRLLSTILLTLLCCSRIGATEALFELEGFFQGHCYDCHDSDTQEAGLDLTQLPRDLRDPQVYEKWVLAHDRVVAGEMPPEKKPRPAEHEIEDFRKLLAKELINFEDARIVKEGRAVKRRLNRYEYENALRELLELPLLEVKDSLPEDPTYHGYNKIGKALDMSYVQLSRYLDVADYALRAAMIHQVDKPQPMQGRYYAWDDNHFWNTVYLGPIMRSNFPLIDYEVQLDIMRGERSAYDRSKRPESQKPYESMAVMASNFEPINGQFSQFKAPHDGWYNLTLSAKTVTISNTFDKASRGMRSEPVRIYSSTHASKLRPLHAIDVTPDRQEFEMRVWLFEGETIHPDATRFPRIRPPDFGNPLAVPQGRPAVAFSWLEVEGPLYQEWPTASHRVLFDDLPIIEHGDDIRVISRESAVDAKRLLKRFMQKAYNRGVTDAEVQPMLDVVVAAMDKGVDFTEALIAGYTGVLASPAFIYFEEDAGKLEALAVAERLSYFLWNSPPDAELLQLANTGELMLPHVLEQQTERLLNDDRSERFIYAFLDYWLDLRHIRKTAPDPVLYPDYQLDDMLEDSMLWETRLYFREMLDHNLGVRTIVDSDFTILNERLANHYGINRAQGAQMQRVTLPADSPRGGILTQASVLKVTADGNNTSPIVRGVWIMERLLGMHPPPPPPNIEAVETDTSGATTIREQLKLHSNSPSCVNCHLKIDPVGFSLENFDVMGGWRDYYRSTGDGELIKGTGHNGLFFNFSRGQPVDASGQLWDGREFADIYELKTILVGEEKLLAKNMTNQLVTYATGAPVSFGDRPEVEQILEKSEYSGYGIRTLIHQIVQSELFLHK